MTNGRLPEQVPTRFNPRHRHRADAAPRPWAERGKKMNSEVARFQFASVQLMLDALRPDEPMFCFYPARLESAARRFLSSFPGHVLFAVKANPAGHILHGLHSAGIKNYDVASVKEIQAVANFPGACLYYMHPVKARSMIAAAYTQYGVKHFSVDTIYELAKVREETRKASDVTVHVRCEVPNTESLYPLDKKFGATTAQAIEIVRCAKDYYREVGLCFHVGSQCMDPAAFRKALGIMGQLARQSAVKIGYINVGGGFPSQYPGMEPPDLQSFMEAIPRRSRRERRIPGSAGAV